MTRICLIFGLLIPQIAWAYPEFIGYKYSSCLTCHYNGHGNGPLNDYGRALWSAEIAGRLFQGGKTQEELGESSGFLGKTKLPDWLRPGVKARYLYVMTQPGTPNSANRSIFMQADANVALLFDQDQKYVFVGSLGYVPEPLRVQNNGGTTDTLISREHYFRYHVTEELWLYLGMMDKVYGIRHVNHTAYSRAATGLAQNDQSHSLIAQYVTPKWEASLDVFMGNMFQDAELRQKGVSGMLEYEIKPSWRLGISALTSSNDFIGNQRVGLHTRYGLGFGSSVLLEVGNIKNTPENSAATNGYYVYSEIFHKIARGYHLFLVGQAYKDDMVGSRPDNLKFGFGTLMFPMARAELRLEVENKRQIYNSAEAPPSTWAVLLQAHMSL
jgi:hypothetical protein